MNEDFESNSLLSDSDDERVIEYHNRTKHRTDGYAKSSGAMDWGNEPAPMRNYSSTAKFKFPLDSPDPKNKYIDIYNGSSDIKPIDFTSIGKFMELSMGLSAWKQYGTNTWALRMNPSSGNLHPTEAYLILPDLKDNSENDVASGVFHYNPFNHEVEKRADLSGTSIIDSQSFYVGLTSIYWRESWKYGERAFRYCNHDVGHAIACLSFSANLMGWDVKLVEGLTDSNVDTFLGLDKTKWYELEEDHGDVILQVTKKGLSVKESLSENMKIFKELEFNGVPNRLSETPVRWQVIEDVSLSTVNKKANNLDSTSSEDEFIKKDYGKIGAVDVIRKRRSAQHFDGDTAMSKEDFISMLDKTLPRQLAPFNTGLNNSYADLLIFVHRVDGLESGLYFYHRGGTDLNDIKSKYNSGFIWEAADGSDNLYFLQGGDFTEASKVVSCTQAIAGDSCFSLGMVVKFKDVIKKDPSMYKKLFWETGMIGQVLYLEAEAIGIRGTGIGCFFDDLVHEKIIGLSPKDNSYQTIYHFTVGGPLEDERLTTLDPYFHLNKKVGEGE